MPRMIRVGDSPGYAPPRFVRLISVGFLLAALLRMPGSAHGQCGSLGPGGPAPNVFWSLKDSVSGCPAGDSLIGVTFPPSVGPRPSRLRIVVSYSDINECQKAGVPPESIWVTTTIVAGNLKVNDAAQKTYADDSTNAYGFTRITLPSFSGCGRVSVQLRVSGISQGNKTATVRTVDNNPPDGRVTDTDAYLEAMCDINYDGQILEQDIAAVLDHLTDWHRNALHGTLVERTNLCDTCAPGQANTMGSGDLSWSPSGKRIAFSIRDQQRNCKIFHAAADPSGGNVPQEFTWPATPDPDDYDPSWSPLGDQIFWMRDDQVIYRKGIPGIASDTTETVVFDAQTADGACCEAISPDGKTVAFSRFDSVAQRWTIWTVPATGGAPHKITAADNSRQWYPKWSPDGQTLIFDRKTGSGVSAHRAAYTVPATADSVVPTLFYDVAGQDAEMPSYAEDGALVVSSVGVIEATTTSHTLDGTGTPGFRPIENYPGYTSGNVFPRLSPDGTRLAMQAKSPFVSGALTPQLWAARRNMNLPPQFTSVGGQSVADSTPRVYFAMLQGHNYQITLRASDPESDPLTYHAYYLQQGMAFADSVFSWTPPAGTAGQVFNVKFGVTTLSGGTDAIVAVINVNANFGPGGSGARVVAGTVSAVSEGAGLVRFAFMGVTPKAAELLVFDLAGRRLARLEGRAGDPLRWDGRDAGGRKVASGVYLYRVRMEGATSWGRLVYLR